MNSPLTRSLTPANAETDDAADVAVLDEERSWQEGSSIIGSLIAKRYRLDSVLAEGGMALVYRGWHVPLDEPIAIKILKSEYARNREAVSRFLQEARAGARLRGKYVPQVLDIGRIDGGPPFMVTELLSGVDLGQLLERTGPLPIELTLELVAEVASALAEIHELGIVHRDLKPANIFRTRDANGKPLIKLLDFGIAKRLDRSDLVNTTSSLGSPHYMAPEQIMSANAVDGRADIWSLGIVLFELLTGRVPFDADSVPGVCGQVLDSEPSPPSTLRPDVSPALDAIVLRCLQKEPNDRFESAAALRQALLELEPYQGAGELEVPITVTLDEEPPLAEFGEEAPPVSHLRKRRLGRVAVAFTMAACVALLVEGWAPARQTLQSSTGAALGAFDRARREVSPALVRWTGSAVGAEQSLLAPPARPGVAATERALVPEVLPTLPDTSNQDSPTPKANSAAKAIPRAPLPALKKLPRAVTRPGVKAPSHDLIDPYPEVP